MRESHVLESRRRQADRNMQARVASLEEAADDARAPATVTVLFVTASPHDVGHLRVDKEFREIQKRIRTSEYRDSIKVEVRNAAQPSDLLDAFNEVKPTIAHFSGHGGEHGFVMEDAEENAVLVTPQQIATMLMFLPTRPKLVLFNACESMALAESALAHVDAVIAMDAEIADHHAREFASQFYNALGHGLSLDGAFGQALLQMELATGSKSGDPRLLVAPEVDARAVFLVAPTAVGDVSANVTDRFQDRDVAPAVVRHLNAPPPSKSIHGFRAAIIVRLDLGEGGTFAEWARSDDVADALQAGVARVATLFKHAEFDFYQEPIGSLVATGAVAEARWNQPAGGPPMHIDNYDMHPPGSHEVPGGEVFEVRAAVDQSGILGARIDIRRGYGGPEVREEQLRWVYLSPLIEMLRDLLPADCRITPVRAQVDFRGFRHATVISEAGQIGALTDTNASSNLAVTVDLPFGLGDVTQDVGAEVWDHLRRSAGLRNSWGQD